MTGATCTLWVYWKVPGEPLRDSVLLLQDKAYDGIMPIRNDVICFSDLFARSVKRRNFHPEGLEIVLESYMAEDRDEAKRFVVIAEAAGFKQSCHRPMDKWPPRSEVVEV